MNRTLDNFGPRPGTGIAHMVSDLKRSSNGDWLGKLETRGAGEPRPSEIGALL